MENTAEGQGNGHQRGKGLAGCPWSSDTDMAVNWVGAHVLCL